MKNLVYLIFGLSFCLSAQERIKLKAIDSIHFKAETIFGIDTFGTTYFNDENNSFYKKTTDTTISYANFQLGKITSADVFNSLKINLFYKDFNTVVILDNRLAEIQKINFNTTEDYKNISLVSTGYDNTIWIYNQDLQLLELYDYINKSTRVKTIPIQSQALALKSDYNYCYLLTEDYLYVYSYFGSLIRKIKNAGFTEMSFSKANLILKKENKLFLLTKNDTELTPLETQNLLINQFLTTNETLYLYNDKKLRQYQLKLN